MTMIDQRLYDIDVKPAGVLPDGADRIRLVLPRVTDPDRVAALFAKKVRVSFRLVDVSISPQEALKDAPPAGSEILYGFKDDTPWLVLKESLLDGDDLSDAAPTYDSRTHDPVVSFRFNARGQRRFAHATEENVGKPFAIVLDDKVLSAPVIREPITGGQGQDFRKLHGSGRQQRRQQAGRRRISRTSDAGRAEARGARHREPLGGVSVFHRPE